MNGAFVAPSNLGTPFDFNFCTTQNTSLSVGSHSRNSPSEDDLCDRLTWRLQLFQFVLFAGHMTACLQLTVPSLNSAQKNHDEPGSYNVTWVGPALLPVCVTYHWGCLPCNVCQIWANPFVVSEFKLMVPWFMLQFLAPLFLTPWNNITFGQ